MPCLRRAEDFKSKIGRTSVGGWRAQGRALLNIWSLDRASTTSRISAAVCPGGSFARKDIARKRGQACGLTRSVSCVGEEFTPPADPERRQIQPFSVPWNSRRVAASDRRTRIDTWPLFAPADRVAARLRGRGLMLEAQAAAQFPRWR